MDSNEHKEEHLASPNRKQKASRVVTPWTPALIGQAQPTRIAACAIVVLLFSISVCTVLAKTAPQRGQPEPMHLTKAGKKWAAATLRSLSLEEKIGQMLMGRCFLDYPSFASQDYRELRDDLQKYHIGSLVVAAHIYRRVAHTFRSLECMRRIESRLPNREPECKRVATVSVVLTVGFSQCGIATDRKALSIGLLPP